MSLNDQITDAMKAAMRAKDKETLGAIRLIMAELKRIEVDERITPDDQRVLAVLDKMVKQRRDSIQQYEAAGRDDLAAKEHSEITVIQTFLPQPLADDELAAMVAAAVEQSGASGMQDMGKVMGLLKPQVQGRADMGKVSSLVKAQLG